MTPPHLASKQFKNEAIHHGFFGRKGGFSHHHYASLNCGPGSDDDPTLVEKNRQLVRKTLDGQLLCTPNQTHSTRAVFIDDKTTRTPSADALVTNVPNLIIGVLTADCMPVLFHDPVTRLIGAAHAGWRGALDGILESCVQLMVAHGADTENIRSVIGPCLQPPHFQIGQDLYQKFTEKYIDSAQFFSRDPDPKKYQFHLTHFAIWRLQSAGLRLEHLFDVQTCTLANHEDFFSYRKSKQSQQADYGRNLAAISLKG